MFIAIPKCVSLTGWKICLFASSKGQARRIIMQQGFLPEQFDIVKIPEQRSKI